MRFQGVIFVGLLFMIFSAACNDRPEKVISDRKMIKLMADMEMAEAYLVSKGATNNTYENRERIISYLLEKNGVTREEYDSTINWYGKHFDKYDELYAKVDKELAARAKKISGKADEIVTTDLWPLARHVELNPLSSSDNVSFRLVPEENEKGNMIEWKFNLLNASSCNGLLGVTYDDGVSSYITKSFSGSGNFDMILQTDTGKVVKNIFGNLHVSEIKTPIMIDSIRLEAIPFDSTEYYRVYSTKRYRGPIAKRKTIITNDSITDTTSPGHIGPEPDNNSAMRTSLEKKNGSDPASGNTITPGVR